MYVCMYVCMHACMHACMYACMHVCIASHDQQNNVLPPSASLCGVKSTHRHQADKDCKMPAGGISPAVDPHLVASLFTGGAPWASISVPPQRGLGAGAFTSQPRLMSCARDRTAPLARPPSLGLGVKVLHPTPRSRPNHPAGCPTRCATDADGVRNLECDKPKMGKLITPAVPPTSFRYTCQVRCSVYVCMYVCR